MSKNMPAFHLIPLLIAPLFLGAPATVPPKLMWERSLLVQLEVSDLNRSIRFYTEVLEFKVTERRDDLQFAHVDCGIAGLQIGLSAGGKTPPNTGTIVLNFGVRGDLEVARRALEGKGVVFLGPTTVIAGKVRLADFKDPDGYRIRLAREDGRAPSEEPKR